MPIITPRTLEFGFAWAKAPERSRVAAGSAVRASFPSSRLVYMGEANTSWRTGNWKLRTGDGELRE